MRRSTTGVLTALVLALTLAACGSGGGGNQVASLGGDARTTASDDGASGGKEQDPDEAFRDFAACMREHGIDMPDPEVRGDGDRVFSAPVSAPSADGGEVRGPSEEFRAAQEECDEHLEGVIEARGDAMSEEDQAKFREQALELAQCMRDRGFDFPDPQFGDGGMVQIGGPEIDPTDPRFEEAMQACAEKAGMPEPGKGAKGGVVAGTRVGGK
jgi:hypothetical protein